MTQLFTIIYCCAFSTSTNKSNGIPILNAAVAKIAVQAIGRSPILINSLGWGLGGGRRDLELRHNLPRPPPNRRYNVKDTQTVLITPLFLCSAFCFLPSVLCSTQTVLMAPLLILLLLCSVLCFLPSVLCLLPSVLRLQSHLCLYMQ